MSGREERVEQSAAEQQVHQQERLLDVLAQVSDPRSRHGRRYPIQALLGIAVAAVLGGAQSLRELAEYAGELTQEQLAALGVPLRPWEARRQAPREAALRKLLHRLDADAVDARICRWVAAWLPAGDRSAVAVDGKTLRGSKLPAGKGVHLLAALVHGQRTVVAQRRVPGKTNEIPGFQPLLDGVDLTGRVVTADAMHTQRDHAEYLVDQRQAGYLLVVKDNQPGLVDAISRLKPAAFSPCAHHR